MHWFWHENDFVSLWFDEVVVDNGFSSSRDCWDFVNRIESKIRFMMNQEMGQKGDEKQMHGPRRYTRCAEKLLFWAESSARTAEHDACRGAAGSELLRGVQTSAFLQDLVFPRYFLRLLKFWANFFVIVNLISFY